MPPKVLPKVLPTVIPKVIPKVLPKVLPKTRRARLRGLFAVPVGRPKFPSMAMGPTGMGATGSFSATNAGPAPQWRPSKG